MGIFDKDEDDEVKISPSEEDGGGNLRDEVETEIVGDSSDSGVSVDSGSSTKSRRGKEIRERSTRSRGSRGSSSGSAGRSSSNVSLEDIHRQNERIIELLEELNADGDNNETGESDFDGVL